MSMHPQEIRLVQVGQTGLTLPTREYDICKAEAEQRGAAYCEAFNEQVSRQDAALLNGVHATRRHRTSSES